MKTIKILAAVIFGFILLLDLHVYSQDQVPSEETSQEDAVQDAASSGPDRSNPSDKPDAPPQDKIPGGVHGFISLNLQNIDIVEALKFLSRKADMDIVTTKNVGGLVTMMVENVPVKDVFDIMLRSNKLAYDRRGDIYSVMTETEYKELYGRTFADIRIVKTLRLNYAIPEQAFTLLDTLKSDVGRVLVDSESGSVLIIDIPERVKEMEKSLEAFERRNDVRIFQLQYASALDVESQLKMQLDFKKVGLIKADERQNQVMVQTLPERMRDIERLIGELDTKTKQVVVDCTIVKVKLTDEATRGMQWEGLFNTLKLESGDMFYVGSTPFSTVNPETTAGTFTSRKETVEEEKYVGSYPFSGTTSSLSSSVPKVASEALHVGLIGTQDFDTFFQYVQTLGRSKIIANPKLVVTNNQESHIHVGERQAYVTTTTTTGQATSTVAEDVTFVDVGTQVSVTPSINNDGFISMKVKVEISSVSSTLVTPTQNRIPIIDTSLAETTVMTKDGTTVILGGLRKEEKTGDVKKMPFFGSIPFLGNIFKMDTKRTENFELIIMLTPRIISGEVFVSKAGQEIGRSAIKEVQAYRDLKHLPKEVPVISDADIKKVIFKGLRVSE